MPDVHLPDPQISITDDGTPTSGVSGDVYFSKSGGIAETRHVFLKGIDAPTIWQTGSYLRVGELGFGTGLNFLVTWHDWNATAPKGAELDYLAVEGYPIPVAQLRDILSRVPELASEAEALLAEWPIRVGGVHRLSFDAGRVRLTLLFGDAGEMLAQAAGAVDAWYLDGFAPSKNPDMWTDDVLSQVRRLSAPGARLATFSAAGAVRRALAELGFAVEKRPGFGRKRDCVAAVLPGTREQAVPETIAVVGAGIAGCTLARTLLARGMNVTLIDKADAPGSAASGNPAALLAPRLPRERTVLGRIMAASYLHAVRFYDVLASEGATVWFGERGGLALARNADEAERQSRAISAFGWPEEVMRQVDAQEAAALSGIETEAGGLWFSAAGTLNPLAIAKHLARDIRYVQADVGGFEKTPGGWVLTAHDGTNIGAYGAIVLAAGVGLMDMPGASHWPLRANRGQLAYLSELRGGPRVPITYGGYLSPKIPLPNGQMGHVLGATYARRDEVPDADWHTLRKEDEAQMLSILADHLPSIDGAEPMGGRVSLRATIRDYVPLAGRVDQGLYVLGGLGSRGFLTAPLLSELIADQLTGAPLPLEADLVQALDPGRFA